MYSTNLKSQKVRCTYIHLCTYSSFCRRPTFWRRFLFLFVYFLFVFVCLYPSLTTTYLYVYITGRGRSVMDAKISPFKRQPIFGITLFSKILLFLKLLTCKRLALNHLPSHYIDIICCREICWSKKMKKEQKYRLILRIKDPRSIVTRFLWCPVDKSHWLHLTRFDSRKVSLGTWSL